MQISPLVFIFAPFLGALTVAAYRAGMEELQEELPVVYSLIYGPLSVLLFSFLLAGIFFPPKFTRFPYVTLIMVVFITAAVIFSLDISVTNNRVIDSILVTVSGIALFSFVIIGFLYVLHHRFPWKLVLIGSSLLIFIIRISLWLTRG